MASLTITRGLQASGKTTYAKAWVQEDPFKKDGIPQKRVRVNRDDMRRMMFGGWTGDVSHEVAVSKAIESLTTTLLGRDMDVIWDNTHLPQRFARDARKLALRNNAEFFVVDFTDVPLDLCITRDAQREGDERIGEDVIRTAWHKFIRGKSYPLPFPDEPETPGMMPDFYVPPAGKPDAVVVDIDGTVAKMVNRSPFDETRVHEDQPNNPVIRFVRAMARESYIIVFVSGRHDVCFDATEKWLNTYVGVDHILLMRKDGDNRKDFLIKREIFDAEIRHNYNVVACLDDRQQVVDMYRDLGLTVLQVAPGNF